MEKDPKKPRQNDDSQSSKGNKERGGKKKEIWTPYTDEEIKEHLLVSSPFPITPILTSQGEKFLSFLCEHFGIQTPLIEEVKTPPGQKTVHYLKITIQGLMN